MNVRAWIRRVFWQRKPDPELDTLKRVHAARAAAVPETVAHATAVAKAVDDSRRETMRASFKRADGRLAR